MKHRLPLVVAVAATGGRHPGVHGLGQDDHLDERIDVRRPAGRQARKGLPQGPPGAATFRLAAGRLGRRRRRRRRRPRDDRQLLARPEAAPIRAASSSTGSRATRSASRRTRATRSPACRRRRSRRSSAARVRDWSQVPGSPKSGPIDLVVRTAASGTQDAFQKIFMGSAKVSLERGQKASNGLVQQAVKSDPNAIGYVSLGVHQGRAHAPATRASPCNLRNAKSGQYGGVRNFWMVTRGRPTGRRAKFIRWIQRSSGGARSIIATELGPDQGLDERNRLRHGHRSRHLERPARRANARRARVAWCSC